MPRQRVIRQLLPAAFVLLAMVVAWLYQRPEEQAPAGGSQDRLEPSVEASKSGSGGATRRPAEFRSGQMAEVTGRVARLLADDDQGSRHQRFIVSLGDSTILLVAHNIDLAPRVPVEKGDQVRVRGQYEYNERGGVLHWTHHDPDGRRRDTGWIEHHGEVYN